MFKLSIYYEKQHLVSTLSGATDAVAALSECRILAQKTADAMRTGLKIRVKDDELERRVAPYDPQLTLFEIAS